MLKKLVIQNYAIIDELEIGFHEQLNIITGETGAGKSILVGALGLILGERADSSVLVNKEKKCIVEGVFLADKRNEIFEFFKNNELDYDPEIVIRREVNANGKSRAFINDTPVNLDQLRHLSGLLVDLHQQFDTLQLAENDFQRQVLDALAGHTDLLLQYQGSYTQWKSLQKEISDLKHQKILVDREADYNRFQFAELEEAGFKENELEELEAELKLLNNAEEIKQALTRLYYELKEKDTPVVQQLKILAGQLQPFSSFHPQLPLLQQRLQSAQVELQDIADELESINQEVQFDAEKIAQLDARLSWGYKLLKKHNVKTTRELLDIQKQLEEKLQAVWNIDETIRQQELAMKTIYTHTEALAQQLSDGRQQQIKFLEEKVNHLLAQVGMPSAKLKVEVKEEAELNAYGKNNIEFLFDANKSGQYMPLKKVASGGELSRLMLCIKSLVAKRIDLPTMIFDEIDTGISGEAARQVGIIMKELTARRQLICITHQPQIAGKASAHFFVYKEMTGKKLKTHIRLLTTEERITVVAQMLSGEKPTAAALENAREMIMN